MTFGGARYNTDIIAAIPDVFGATVARPRPDTPSSSFGGQQRNTEPSDKIMRLDNSQVGNDARAEGKERERMPRRETRNDVTSQKTASGAPGTKQQFGASTSKSSVFQSFLTPECDTEAIFGVDGEERNNSEITFEDVRSMIESISISQNKNGTRVPRSRESRQSLPIECFLFLLAMFPAVKLVSPPPSHPTTSILRPTATPNPQPKDDEESKPYSPLDYTTNIGKASVVREIYLEARNTGVPRTPEEELRRRHRACRLVLKEIIDVIQEVRWHRNGRGYEEGPGPCVLGGIESVPVEEKREWLAERRTVLKGRQRECRTTICDNNEAADHIAAVVNAMHVCQQAGAEGITF